MGKFNEFNRLTIWSSQNIFSFIFRWSSVFRWIIEDSEIGALSSQVATKHEKNVIKYGHYLSSRWAHVANNGLNKFINIFFSDVCFSQALTALITALTAKFWNNRIDKLYIETLCSVGPLAYFEGFLYVFNVAFHNTVEMFNWLFIISGLCMAMSLTFGAIWM